MGLGFLSRPDVGYDRQFCNGIVHSKQRVPEGLDHEQALQSAVDVARVPQIIQP